MQPVAQELLTHPEYLSSPPIISGVRVARALVFCIIFCRSMIVRFFFYLGHYIVSFFDLQHLNTSLIDILKLVPASSERPSGSWSYGSWIYNYLCNKCLSTLKLRVRVPLKRGVHDKKKFVSDLLQVSSFSWYSRFPLPINMTDTLLLKHFWKWR